jgi:hypothetical protein
MKTKIHPIFGVPGGEDQGNAIGQFYVSLTNPLCMYDLPGGSIAMSFASSPVYPDVGFNTFVPFSDNHGGAYLDRYPFESLEAAGDARRSDRGHG